MLITLYPEGEQSLAHLESLITILYMVSIQKTKKTNKSRKTRIYMNVSNSDPLRYQACTRAKEQGTEWTATTTSDAPDTARCAHRRTDVRERMAASVNRVQARCVSLRAPLHDLRSPRGTILFPLLLSSFFFFLFSFFFFLFSFSFLLPLPALIRTCR